MENKKPFRKLLFESPSVEKQEEEELKRGDFDFERRLGDGAFGQVWRVRHRNTSKIYGLKVVAKVKVIDMLPQFKREVFIMYELNHPHIIKLYNHFEDERYFYLIMEIAEGGNMYHKLHREKQFIERVAAQYFREILLAVEYLHSHVPAIIHRDLKPENILFDADGTVKLSDFGWSNYYSEDNLAPRTTICGTLEYLPPEMIDRMAHDTAADVWCLGVLLFEMLVGSTPFKARAKDQMLNNIRVIKPKFPMNFPPVAKDLVVKMLNKDAKERLNIFEVKEHRWLNEHPPIRETISQAGLQIPLPDLKDDTVLAITKGYQVINEADEKAKSKRDRIMSGTAELKEAPKNEMDFIEAQEDKECLRIITDKAIRLSLSHMKDRMKKVHSEYTESKGKIEAQTHKLNDMKKIAQDHEKHISSKVTILRHMNQAQKTLILQLSDKTFEIESLQKNTSSADVLGRINKKRTRLMEMTSECKMKNKVLESLQAQIQYSNNVILEKDKEIAALKTQRDLIQSENQPGISALKSKISELEISKGVIKTRLRNHEKFNTELREEDSKVANEIMNMMRHKFNCFKHISESEMGCNIDSLREKISEKEQLITEATLEYQDRKSKIAQNLRNQKEKILAEYRRKKEEIETERKKLLVGLKQELRDKLFLSRVQQEAFFVEESEIQESKQTLNVTFIQDLKETFSSLLKEIESHRALKASNRSQFSNLTSQLKYKEAELNHVKSQHSPTALQFK